MDRATPRCISPCNGDVSVPQVEAAHFAQHAFDIIIGIKTISAMVLELGQARLVSPPLFERLQNQGVQQLPKLEAHRSGRVSHEYHGELLGGVGPEIWASRTRPMVFAG